MTPRRRILVVAKNLQQGGTERQLLRMIRGLDGARFEVVLCTLSPERHYDDLVPGQAHYAYHVNGRNAVARIADCIDEVRPDVVHSFRDVVNRYVFRALSRTQHQPAWIASVRGRPMLPVDLVGTHRFFRRAFRIVVNSVGIQQTLRLFARVPDDKIVVVPNLIEPSPAGSGRERDQLAARAALGLPANCGFVWVLPGRLSWVKNQLGLVFALALGKALRTLPRDAIVVLAGRVRDRLAARLIGPLAWLLRVSRHLHYVGSLKDVGVLYQAADALVLPSWAEGMPNVVLEAQLESLPAVVTRQANRDGLVLDGESGFVASTGSPLSLARALGRLMALPVPSRQSMGQRGREQLLDRYATHSAMRDLESIYEQAARAFPGVKAGDVRPDGALPMASDAQHPIAISSRGRS